ncbi:hypothetical protein CNY89_29165, partial [Amaricoccus sp. HAR-UPW-R2A-40]
RAVSHRPEAIFTDERAYLMTRVAIRRIEAAPPGDATALEDPAEMLWRAARSATGRRPSSPTSGPI